MDVEMKKQMIGETISQSFLDETKQYGHHWKRDRGTMEVACERCKLNPKRDKRMLHCDAVMVAAKEEQK